MRTTVMACACLVLLVGCDPFFGYWLKLERAHQRSSVAESRSRSAPSNSATETHAPVAVPSAQGNAPNSQNRESPRAPSKPTTLEEGLEAFRQGRYEAAVWLLDRAGGLVEYSEGDRVEAILCAGMACYYLGRESEAIARFGRVLDRRPGLVPSSREFTPEARGLFERVRQNRKAR